MHSFRLAVLGGVFGLLCGATPSPAQDDALVPETMPAQAAKPLPPSERYGIIRPYISPSPGQVQLAAGSGLSIASFGSRDGVQPGSLFTVGRQDQTIGEVRVETLWRDSAAVRLINLYHKPDPAAVYPLAQEDWLKPKRVLLETVHFNSDTPAIDPDMYERLRYVARFILAFADFPVALEGHTDDRGKASTNLELSRHRGQMIKDYLHKIHRIPLDQMHLVGRGETRPLASNNTPEGRQTNRRVEILLVDHLEGQAKPQDPPVQPAAEPQKPDR